MMRRPVVHQAEGFSIVELMVAMVIGLVLMSGMISVFLANNQSANFNAALASIQEDARFALETIARDVRMTGFQGCTTASEDYLTIVAEDAPLDDFTVGLTQSSIWASKAVSSSTWTPRLPWGTSFSPPTDYPAIAGTDILGLQFGDTTVYTLDAPVGVDTPDVSGVIQITGDPEDINIGTGDLAIISDCKGGDLFFVTGTETAGPTAMQISHKAGELQNSSGALTRIYGDTAASMRQTKVMRFNSGIYYVGDTGLTNNRGDAMSSLYQQTFPFDISNPPVELVQSVEHMAISFTQVDDAGNVQDVSAGDTGFNSAHIQAVRIGLLLASYDEIADDNDSKTYVIAGQSVVPRTDSIAGDMTHAADRRLRLAFNTTVKVRNTRAPQ